PWHTAASPQLSSTQPADRGAFPGGAGRRGGLPQRLAHHRDARARARARGLRRSRLRAFVALPRLPPPHPGGGPAGRACRPHPGGVPARDAAAASGRAGGRDIGRGRRPAGCRCGRACRTGRGRPRRHGDARRSRLASGQPRCDHAAPAVRRGGHARGAARAGTRRPGRKTGRRSLPAPRTPRRRPPPPPSLRRPDRWVASPGPPVTELHGPSAGPYDGPPWPPGPDKVSFAGPFAGATYNESSCPMSKALIIAEKPSVAADIARAPGGFTRHGDYYESDEYVLCSAVGHLLEIKAPDDVEVKRGKWSFANLPVIPPFFELQPIKKGEERLKLLKRLIRRK